MRWRWNWKIRIRRIGDGENRPDWMVNKYWRVECGNWANDVSTWAEALAQGLRVQRDWEQVEARQRSR